MKLNNISKEELFDLIPKSWKDITVVDYMNLVELQLKQQEYSGFNYLFNKLVILTGIDLNESVYYKLTISECRLIERQLKWLEQMPNNYSNKIKIDDNVYELINFNTLLVSEYAALDYYVTNDIVNNIHRIVSILYRKFKMNEFDNYIKEPFDFNYEERAELFLEQPMNIIYCVDKFLEFRLNIQNMFPYCFSKKQDYDNLSEEEKKELLELEELEKKEYEKMNFREKAAYNEQKRKELLEQTFTWEYLILDLAKNDIIKAHSVYQFEVLYVFQMINAIKSQK